MQQSAISFKAQIIPLPKDAFDKEVESISYKYRVDWPWRADEMVFSDKAYTEGIKNCTAGGIIDGDKVVFFHISSTNWENNDFSKIIRKIKTKIDLESPNLKGFLLGSEPYFEKSKELFKKFENFMSDYKIPYSYLKGHTVKSSNTSLAYKADKDAWFVTNPYISYLLEKYPNMSAKRVLKKAFLKTKISSFDRVFEKNIPKNGVLTRLKKLVCSVCMH